MHFIKLKMNFHRFSIATGLAVLVFTSSASADPTSIGRFDFSKAQWNYRPATGSSFSIGASVAYIHTDEGIYDPPISTYTSRSTSLTGISRSDDGLYLDVARSSYLPGRATEEFLIQYRLVYGSYYNYETQVALLYDQPLRFKVQADDPTIATLTGYAEIQYPGPVLMFGAHPGTQKPVPVDTPNGWLIPFSYSLVNLTGEWTEASIAQDVNYKVDGYFDFAGAIPPKPKKSVILLEGEPVPGAGAGTIPADAVWSGFGTPAINDQGHIAFLGEWKSSAGRGKGVFVGSPDSPELFATVGQQVPGMDEGVTFQDIKDPLLNDAGEVVFIAQLRGAGTNSRNRSAVFKDMPNTRGEPILLIRQGHSNDAQETLMSIDNVALSNFEDGNSAVFVTGSTHYIVGRKPMSPAHSLRRTSPGLWAVTTDNDKPRLILKPGDGIDLGSGPETLRRIHVLSGGAGQGRGLVQPEGDVATAMLMVETVERGIGVGTVGEFGGQSFPYAVGMQAPGLDEGLVFQGFGQPTQDDTSLLAFRASIGTSRSRSRELEVLYAEDHTYTARPLVMTGDAAPGIDGATFTSFSDPVSAREGMISFTATVDGMQRPISGMPAGIWTGTQDGIVLNAAQNGNAPDTNGARYRSFETLALPANAAGPIFVADLQREWPATTSSNDRGLWVTTGTGEARLLLREGDDLDGLTVGQFEVLNEVDGSPAQTRSFNATGMIVTRVKFTDGREALVQLRYY